MPDRIDHATEAQRLLHQWSREAMPVAQVHATLALVEQLAAEPALKRYHLLPGVRGDLPERRHLQARRGRHRPD